jgi:putative membrane protein
VSNATASSAAKPGARILDDRLFYAANAVVSAAALALLFWLLIIRKPAPGQSALLDFLPALNAILNTTSAVLLVLGRRAVKRGDRKLHAKLMLAAFAASSIFLVSYLGYHYVHGDTHYAGAHAMRLFYLSVLVSHILMSIAVVPLVLAALWFAWRKTFNKHTRVTRVLYPIWLYVSVTGVAVYLLLYQLPHG